MGEEVQGIYRRLINVTVEKEKGFKKKTSKLRISPCTIEPIRPCQFAPDVIEGLSVDP